MKLAMSPMEKVRAARKLLDVKLDQRPLTVSTEVTKRRDDWRGSDRGELPAVSRPAELSSKGCPGPSCGRCFDSRRAEPQAPLTLRRLGELSGLV